MIKRRSEIEILCEIIKVVHGGEGVPTRIMGKANLSWSPMREWLALLVDKGILMKQKSDNGDARHSVTYGLTNKGMKIAAKLADADDIWSLFE